MKYCCHVWADGPRCYLELLDSLQKWIWRTVGPSLAASLEPLVHCGNVDSLSLICRYYRSSITVVGVHTLVDVHGFSVTIPRCYKDVYVKSFLPRTARLWNSLPIECFPLTYDLNGFKSRINRHLLTVGPF